VDGVLRVWDVAEGSEVFAVSDHEYGVNTAVWSADGTRLLTGDGNGTIRLRQGDNGRAIREVARLSAPVVELGL
jgi:WD40 repeat protein